MEREAVQVRAMIEVRRKCGEQRVKVKECEKRERVREAARAIGRRKKRPTTDRGVKSGCGRDVHAEEARV